MNYIPLEQLKNAWVFKRKDLPIADPDMLAIKPMSLARSATLWATSISQTVDHPDFFTEDDWVLKKEHCTSTGRWEERWDSEEPKLPDEIINHLDWQDNTTVYFALSRKIVIETSWAVFKRCWKNFLMMDDGPFLIAKKRDQYVQFLSDGNYRLGNKP